MAILVVVMVGVIAAIIYVERGHPFATSVDRHDEDIVIGRKQPYLLKGAVRVDDRPWRGTKRECH